MSTLLKILVFMTLLGIGLVWFQRRNLYFPTHEWESIPNTFGIKSDDVFFQTANGVSLSGWLIPAKHTSSTKAPLTVLLCHGNGGNISHRVRKAHLLSQLGLNVFLFDYRGYGKSEGFPSEKGTYKDAEAAYEWLTRERKVPSTDLVLYGESLGCAVALETALHYPARVLILESPFTSTVAMAKLVFPFLPVRWMVFDRYDNLSKIHRLRMPLLVMHSPQDDIVPFSMGTQLFDKAPEPKTFFTLEGNHNEGFLETGLHYGTGRCFLS